MGYDARRRLGEGRCRCFRPLLEAERVRSPDLFPACGDSPDPQRLAALLERIDSVAARTRREGPWASGSFAALAEHGVLAGFIPEDAGGSGANPAAIARLLMALAGSCLTTSLAVTQWAAGCRIIGEAAAEVRRRYQRPLAAGETFTTVGISQLSTSRRHLARPPLLASRVGEGWQLDGLCPWVTGADAVESIVTGAMTDDGEAMFFIVDTQAAGLRIESPMDLLALSGSRTACVHFDGVHPAEVIEPPTGRRPAAGGLTTSMLALGAAAGSVRLLEAEAARREEIEPVAAGLADEIATARERLLAAVLSPAEASPEAIRQEANNLVVRAAEASLVAAKGAGFVRGHPAERAVRESMFFLVWSCPQAVTATTLCELAGI
jgi:alkylation response protein AidB-like acyl-CoA dehydrogenase